VRQIAIDAFALPRDLIYAAVRRSSTRADGGIGNADLADRQLRVAFSTTKNEHHPVLANDQEPSSTSGPAQFGALGLPSRRWAPQRVRIRIRIRH